MSLPAIKRKQSGFTLLELLIVVAIISILISIGLASYSRVQRSARDSQRRSDLKNIQGALEQYYSDHNVYPNALSDLTSGTVYMKEIPTDPQSVSYIYTGGGQTYCLGSQNMETVANDSETCGSDDYGFVLTPQD